MKLVLLPGMDGTGFTQEPVLPWLGPAHEGVLVTYPRGRMLDYRQLEAYVRARLPDEEPYWLAGQSFSGPLAVRLAAAPPAGLRGVILIASFVTSPVPAVLELLSWALGSLPFRLPPPAWVLRKRFLGPEASDEQVAGFAALLDTVAPEVLAGRLAEIRRVDVRAELAAAKVPVAYLRARQDRMVGRRMLEEVRGILPGVRVCEVDGPHILLLTHPEASAAALRAVLEG